MTSTRPARGARRAAARLASCALTATLLTMGGTGSVAAAEPQSVKVTYDSPGDWTSDNSYKVSITATVTRNGDRYTLKGTVKSMCLRSQGPAQKWGLAFGSSAESWRYAEGPCGESAERTEKIERTGPLRPDGRVYLQAGAWGGKIDGAWGWGTQRSVWV
ncbi:hypothetical protein [Streptomyces microflavus]|uniref:hypothetical protein n=1 Tax=Streptomyces microflavus TaxID=1919 RepID=UPI003674FC04